MPEESKKPNPLLMVTDADYQGHVVFSELDYLISFYEQLAISVFSWHSRGTRSLCGTDSYVFSSIQGTLTSIQLVLRDGRINDAYALFRKYLDSVAINIYANLYLDEKYSIENLIVEQIDNWMTGKEGLPPFREISEYIKNSRVVKHITDVIQSDDRYKRIRQRGNDHTHYNFFGTLLLNDKDLSIPGRAKALDNIIVDLRDTFIFHIAYIFSIREIYMMASDHLDSLESGLEPDPDSQYWVAPFIQEAFDKLITVHRPDITNAIKSSISMQLT